MGPLGAGKSTLLGVLSGALPVAGGRVTYPFLRGATWPGDVMVMLKQQQHGSGGSGGAGGGAGGYYSERYHSRREHGDTTVRQWLASQVPIPTDTSSQSRSPTVFPRSGGSEDTLHVPDERVQPLDEEGYETRSEDGSGGGGETSTGGSDDLVERVARDLDLDGQLDTSTLNLSNGQHKRAHIAALILRAPRVLLLDEPYVGLDPAARATLTRVLGRLARADRGDGLGSERGGPSIILALRPLDKVPEWCTHCIWLHDPPRPSHKRDGKVDHTKGLDAKGEGQGQGQGDGTLGAGSSSVRYVGPIHHGSAARDELERERRDLVDALHRERQRYVQQRNDTQTQTGVHHHTASQSEAAIPHGVLETVHEQARDTENDMDREEGREVLVALKDVGVKYWDTPVLTSITWTIRSGEQWHLSGSNGSGKTTLLALITGDHPKVYANDVTVFGKRRTVGRGGDSVFEVQRRIGHTSPEIHRHYPRYLTGLACLHSAFSESFTPPARGVTQAQTAMVDSIVSYFAVEHLLGTRLRDMSGADGRLFLLLRALVKRPRLLVLDEPFAGMEAHQIVLAKRYISEEVDRSLQSVIFVTHHEDEVPISVTRFLRLDKGRVVEMR